MVNRGSTAQAIHLDEKHGRTENGKSFVIYFLFFHYIFLFSFLFFSFLLFSLPLFSSLLFYFLLFSSFLFSFLFFSFLLFSFLIFSSLLFYFLLFSSLLLSFDFLFYLSSAFSWLLTCLLICSSLLFYSISHLSDSFLFLSLVFFIFSCSLHISLFSSYFPVFLIFPCFFIFIGPDDDDNIDTKTMLSALKVKI